MRARKSLGNRIWEFMISMVGIFGFISLMNVKVEQGIIYAVFVGGILILIVEHIVRFFKKLDENIKYIRDILERDRDEN